MGRGQDVGCGLGSWQQDLLALESDLIGHAIAGQIVTILTSTIAIIHATPVLIIEIDVPNRILVGSILRAPKDQPTKKSGHAASLGENENASFSDLDTPPQ